MKFASIIWLAMPILLAGCSDREFDRFMDHPILSWAPFTQSDVDRISPISLSRPVAQRYTDAECRQLARERTEVLDRDQFSDEELANVFERIYRDCVTDKLRHPIR